MKSAAHEKDVHLPGWVCGLGVLLFLIAGVCTLQAINNPDNWLPHAIAGVMVLGLGVAAILCWKNQWIEVLDDETFLYSTMLGKKKSYRFADIQRLNKNNDSFTLIMKDGKVHIESCAVISSRFMKALYARV